MRLYNHTINDLCLDCGEQSTSSIFTLPPKQKTLTITMAKVISKVNGDCDRCDRQCKESTALSVAFYCWPGGHWWTLIYEKTNVSNPPIFPVHWSKTNQPALVQKKMALKKEDLYPNLSTRSTSHDLFHFVSSLSLLRTSSNLRMYHDGPILGPLLLDCWIENDAIKHPTHSVFTKL